MKLIDTPFIAYDFSDEELAIAGVFTEMQEKYLRTELSSIAAEKLALSYDPLNPQMFAFEHEYLRGKLEGLTYLLNRSDDMKSQLQQALQAAALSQSKQQ